MRKKSINVLPYSMCGGTGETLVNNVLDCRQKFEAASFRIHYSYNNFSDIYHSCNMELYVEDRFWETTPEVLLILPKGPTNP